MFSHSVHRVGDEVCVALAGEPDFADQARLAGVLMRVLDGRPGMVRVDVGSVEFIDCAAVGALISARNAATGRGARLVVSNPRGPVLRLLQMLDLVTHLVDVPEHDASASRQVPG